MCVVDQQMHIGKICLSYIIYYLHVSVAIATIIKVPSQGYNKLPHCFSIDHLVLWWMSQGLPMVMNLSDYTLLKTDTI